MRHGYRLLSHQSTPPPAAVREMLRLPEGRCLLHLRALHSADDAPFCLEDRWINPEAAPGIEAADFSVISPNEWLVQNTAFSGGDIAFSARPADPAQAEALGCRAGDALFVITRSTWAGAAPITAVTLAYAPGHALVTAI